MFDINNYIGDHRLLWISLNFEYNKICSLVSLKKNIIVSRRGDASYVNYISVSMLKIGKLLGTSNDNIIVTDVEYLTPNLLCQIVETITHHGLLTLCLNESIEKLNSNNKYESSMFEYTERSALIDRFRTLVKLNDRVLITKYENDMINIIQEPNSINIIDDKIKKRNFVECSKNGCYTIDQKNASEEILNILNKKCGQIIAVTSARGRGKTSLIAIIAAEIIKDTDKKVLILYNVEATISTIKNKLKYFLTLPNESNINAKNIYFAHYTKFRSANNCKYEFICLDEAASFPIDYIQQILECYKTNNIILTTTTDGYEGTGKYFKLKLLKKLAIHQKVHNISLETPIRYYATDSLEQFINRYFLLDSEQYSTNYFENVDEHNLVISHINKYELYTKYENNELFNNVMSILVSAHYMNTPNDLQLLSDCNAHQLFVLHDKNNTKNIIGVVQIAFEGHINDIAIDNYLHTNISGNGELINWKILEYFRSTKYNLNEGCRIVRIAIHPKLQGKKLGTKLMNKIVIELQKQKLKYESYINPNIMNELGKNILFNTVKDYLQTFPYSINWIGTSFGCTKQLYNFWQKLSFNIVYLSNVKNCITGEFSCIMLHSSSKQYNAIIKDFYDRFTHTITIWPFNKIESTLVGNIIYNNEFEYKYNAMEISDTEKLRLIDYFDEKIDLAIVIYLVIKYLNIFIHNNLHKNSTITSLQLTLLIGIYMQGKNINEISLETGVKTSKLTYVVKQAIDNLLEYFLEKCNVNKSLKIEISD